MHEFANFHIILGNMWKELQKMCCICALNTVVGVLRGKIESNMVQLGRHFLNKKFSFSDMVYNIMHRNVFNTFKYYGQQCAYFE